MQSVIFPSTRNHHWLSSRCTSQSTLQSPTNWTKARNNTQLSPAHRFQPLFFKTLPLGPSWLLQPWHSRMPTGPVPATTAVSRRKFSFQRTTQRTRAPARQWATRSSSPNHSHSSVRLSQSWQNRAVDFLVNRHARMIFTLERSWARESSGQSSWRSISKQAVYSPLKSSTKICSRAKNFKINFWGN